MWNDLTMSERADVIKMAVKAGLRDMKSIRKFYDDSLKYADGGPKVTSKNRGNLFSGKDTPTQQMTTKSKQAPWYSELDEAVMGELMQEFRNIAHPGNIEHASYKTDVRGKKGGTAQRTYLLPRFEQEDIFLRDGYIKGKEGDYGLVKKAVNNRNLPVWQTKPDVVSRETLVPIGNAYGMDSYGYINRDKDLVHAESHPAAFYVDGSTGKLYTKGWDLNDYGGIGGGNSSKYNILEKVGANILDFIGSPVVVTTGFQEVTNPWGGPSEHLNRGATIQDLFDYDDDGHPIKSNLGKLLDTTMNKQGLHRENIDGKWVYSLPEVTVYGNKKAEGGPKATYGKPYYSYDKNMQIETDNGKPILNYSATLPEVNIIPDSKKSPADRNEARRFRQKTFSDYAEHKDREYTQKQIMKSQRDWDNSLEKRALGYAQDAMTGIGIGADIVSGLPIYSSLKGSRVLSEADSLPEYIEGGLWLAPIGGVMGKEAYSAGKTGIVKAVEGLQNNFPGIFDPYTSFGATFGNYGNNTFSKMYGTLARRYNLPDKARLPADTMRKLKEGVHIDNGIIDLTGGKAYTGKPHVNSTTDRGVVSHSLGQWEGADTYITPTKNFIEQAGNSLKSIEPSDMFSNGVRITEYPQNTVLISGDIGALQRAKEIGMQTLSSPRLRKLYAEQLSKYKVEKEAFDKAYSEASGIQRRIMKAPSTPKYKKWWSYYTDEQQRLQQLRGTPTLKDYQLLEDITGLKSGTAPIEEMSNAVKNLEEMSNATILDITNGSILPYTYPNGRVVDWTKVAKELELVKKAKYNNVFYDPASTVESDWQKTLSNQYAEGGSIHIAPSKRGTFTAAATKHGMGVQEFASKVLANKDNYSPTMVKKANFAKNASKWNHGLGGYLFI